MKNNETFEQILMKIKSLKLCMMAHPDYEYGSEFDDRVEDLEELEIEISNLKKERSYSEEEVTQLLIKFNQEIEEVEDVREWFEQHKKK